MKEFKNNSEFVAWLKDASRSDLVERIIYLECKLDGEKSIRKAYSDFVLKHRWILRWFA